MTNVLYMQNALDFLMDIHEFSPPPSSNTSTAQTSPQHVKKPVEPLTEDFIQFQILSSSFPKISSFNNLYLGKTKEVSMLFF